MAFSRLLTLMIITIMILILIKQQAECVSYYNTDDQIDKNSLIDFKNTSECPPWFLYENTTSQCECGDELNGVLCCDNDRKKVYIMVCQCMTFDKELGITVGSCFTNCVLKKSNLSFQMYLQIPSNLSQLNEVMCEEHWNRTGRLCGECKDEHYPLVYSYDMRCINCTHADVNNWLKYISSAFLPLTVFFVFVLVSGISATSPQLEAFILFAQIVSTPANVRMIFEALDSNNYPLSKVVFQLIVTLYGIWNLDFFRTLLPHNCLKLSTLQVLALDYVIAVYPLALILVTYIVVDLYDRRFFLLIWIIKPFNFFIKSVDSSMTIKSSILSTFVTFLLLSYGKFLTVSFDLLAFTQVYSPSGKAVRTVLFYDASIDYFGQTHLPYGIIAIIVIFCFNIVPLLFSLIHPFKCFKGLLGKWPALQICLDSFQGCYKDGTEGSRDCRFFSSLYLIIRIVLFMLYSFTKNATFYPLASIILLLLVSLFNLFQPFKPQFKVYNSTHALLILNASFLCSTTTIVCLASFTASYIIMDIVCFVSVISFILPLFHITYFILRWFYCKSCFQHYILKHCCSKFQRIRNVINETNDTQESDTEESLPHRLQAIVEDEPFHKTINSAKNSNYGSIQERKSTAY